MRYTANWERFPAIEAMPTSKKYLQLDGDQRFVHSWWQADEQRDPAGVVAVVHGLGEHGGRYGSLAEHLVEQSYAVFAFDQQGHGKNALPRGCIVSYDALLSDIERFLAWIRERYPGVPVALLGHSMGGNLVLNYACLRGLLPAAVISSSPMIRARREISQGAYIGARIVRHLAPNFQLQSIVRAERLMSDPEEQASLIEDPLFHARLSLRLGAGLIDSGRWLLNNAARLQVQTLLSHGTTDDLTCPEASAQFARAAGEKCEFLRLPDLLHDTFRCLEREQVLAPMRSFLEQRLKVKDTQ